LAWRSLLPGVEVSDRITVKINNASLFIFASNEVYSSGTNHRLRCQKLSTVGREIFYGNDSRSRQTRRSIRN